MTDHTPPTEHKPTTPDLVFPDHARDCYMNTASTCRPTCTCGADKPTQPARKKPMANYAWNDTIAKLTEAPPAPPCGTDEPTGCTYCEHEHKLCGTPPCNYTPKAAPTADAVREARDRINALPTFYKYPFAGVGAFKEVPPHILRTILAALDRSQEEVEELREEANQYTEALAAAQERNIELLKRLTAIRAENARPVEELTEARAAAHASEQAFKEQCAQLRAEEQANAAQAKQIKRLREWARKLGCTSCAYKFLDNETSPCSGRQPDKCDGWLFELDQTKGASK